MPATVARKGLYYAQSFRTDVRAPEMRKPAGTRPASPLNNLRLNAVAGARKRLLLGVMIPNYSEITSRAAAVREGGMGYNHCDAWVHDFAH